MTSFEDLKEELAEYVESFSGYQQSGNKLIACVEQFIIDHEDEEMKAKDGEITKEMKYIGQSIDFIAKHLKCNSTSIKALKETIQDEDFQEELRLGVVDYLAGDDDGIWMKSFENIAIIDVKKYYSFTGYMKNAVIGDKCWIVYESKSPKTRGHILRTPVMTYKNNRNGVCDYEYSYEKYKKPQKIVTQKKKYNGFVFDPKGTKKKEMIDVVEEIPESRETITISKRFSDEFCKCVYAIYVLKTSI